MNIYEVMGLVGAFLSSITFIPQVIQVYKTKSAKDLNMKMLLIIVLSTIVWLIYGFGKNALPVIIANAIIFVLCSWLILFKIRN